MWYVVDPKVAMWCMTGYFEMDVMENSLYCIVIVTVTASSLSSLRRSNVDFPSEAAFLGDFLPSSKGSKPFPSCSSMTSMIAVDEEREKEKKKGPSALNKLIITFVH